MNAALLAIYRILVMPVVVVLLPIVALFNKKVSAGMRLRRGPLEGFPPGENPVWIHAASGEFEYAKAVIRELKQRHPEIPILVTYFSPTFAKAAASFAGVDRAIALPLDLPGPCASFLRKMHPRALLVARTDLWPEMLERCRRAQIPVVLFSYTQKAIRSPVKKVFTRVMLKWVKRVYCVSPVDLEHLKQVAPDVNALVIGDSRYDQVYFRLTHPKELPKALMPHGPSLVAGSTWPQDEAVLLKGLAPLLLAGSLKLILVPHEPTPEHLTSLEAQLKAYGLTYSFYSYGTAWDHEHVLLVDKVGVLAELYAWGQFAFVGGSFRKSVHSVMEALGAGCVTFVGPLHENNREAIEFKALPVGSSYGLQVVTTAEELGEKVAARLKEPRALEKFSRELQAEFKSRLGASAKQVDGITDLL